ncbi:MAG: glycosyltransferase [Candidatus Sigynarchaeota archaeon]
MKISVILPVYSEEESIIYVVDKLIKSIKEKLYEVIIIVSPRSSERTVTICKNLAQTRNGVRFFFQKANPGLGRAVREGLKRASGTHILMIDSDGEMEPADAVKMIAKIEATGCDMVVGSRWIKGGGVEGYNSIKYVMNRGFQIFFKFLFFTKLHDLTLGFKLLSRKIVDHVKFQSNFHDIALETTIKPICYGFKAEEVPIIWRRRKTGHSKNSIFNNLRYLIRAVLVRIKD